jgi:hypothetical protein
MTNGASLGRGRDLAPPASGTDAGKNGGVASLADRVPGARVLAWARTFALVGAVLLGLLLMHGGLSAEPTPSPGRDAAMAAHPVARVATDTAASMAQTAPAMSDALTIDASQLAVPRSMSWFGCEAAGCGGHGGVGVPALRLAGSRRLAVWSLLDLRSGQAQGAVGGASGPSLDSHSRPQAQPDDTQGHHGDQGEV